MTTTTLARRKLIATWEEDNRWWELDAHLSLNHIDGNKSPHFSATADLYRRMTLVSCGCLHEEILKLFPEAEVVVKVHRADDHGVPMAPWANAVHWAGYSTWGSSGAPMSPKDKYGRIPVITTGGVEWSPEMLSKHLRVSTEEAAEIRLSAAALHNASANSAESTITWVSAFEIACSTLRDLPARWQADADAALAFIKEAT